MALNGEVSYFLSQVCRRHLQRVWHRRGFERVVAPGDIIRTDDASHRAKVRAISGRGHRQRLKLHPHEILRTQRRNRSQGQERKRRWQFERSSQESMKSYIHLSIYPSIYLSIYLSI